MKVIKFTDDFPKLKNPVVTMGMFDGVHLGHQKILQLLADKAKEIDGESVLITFDPHPRFLLQKDTDLKLITSLDIKIKKLEQFGLQNLLVIPFTKEFSRLSSFDFVRDVIANKINAHSFYIGYDHHFGKNREGDFDQLKGYADIFDFFLCKIEAVSLSSVAISSTKIRKALQNGDLVYANKALGETFSLEGIVVEGDKLGRTIGFPTANLEVDNKQIIPKNGVYYVKVVAGEASFHGMMNIGIRPSIKIKNEQRIEVHILDFSNDIYGENIEVFFIERLRDEIRFDSLNELKEQIEKDQEHIKEIILSEK